MALGQVALGQAALGQAASPIPEGHHSWNGYRWAQRALYLLERLGWFYAELQQEIINPQACNKCTAL